MKRATRRAVTVTIEWKNRGVRVTPWQVEAERGQGIEWVVVGAPECTVAKKTGRSWPLGKKKYKGRRVRAAVSRNARLRTYRYDIRLDTGSGELVIDPEMIIRR